MTGRWSRVWKRTLRQERIVRRTLLVFMAFQLASGLWAREGSAQDVEELARQGAELFQQGRFREAAKVLVQAYETEPVPVLLYNIARAYQQDGRCYAATDYFTQYIESGDTQALSQAQTHAPGEAECAEQYSDLMRQADDALNSGNMAEAEQLVSQALEVSDEPNARIVYEQTLFQLGQCQESRDFIISVQGQVDYTEAQQSEIEGDLARAQECVEDRRCADMRTECEAENERLLSEASGADNNRRLISYIVGGAGAAVLLGAIIHDAATQSTIDDYKEAALAQDVDEFNRLRDDIDSAKTLSWILYGVGIAGIATGVVLFFTADLGGEAPDLEDCGEVCWDFGFGSPSGDPGVWLGGTF